MSEDRHAAEARRLAGALLDMAMQGRLSLSIAWREGDMQTLAKPISAALARAEREGMARGMERAARLTKAEADSLRCAQDYRPADCLEGQARRLEVEARRLREGKSDG